MTIKIRMNKLYFMIGCCADPIKPEQPNNFFLKKTRCVLQPLTSINFESIATFNRNLKDQIDL